MPLITCPECKNKISDLAEACPKCGIPLSKEVVSGMSCPDCKTVVTSLDEACPKCGCPLLKKADDALKRQANDITSGWNVLKYVIYFAIFFAVMTGISNCFQNHSY